MASSKDVQEQFLSRVRQVVQDKCTAFLNAANTQMRSNIEPLKVRIMALEKENALLKEQIDDLKHNQTSTAVLDDKMLGIGGDVNVLKQAQSETRRDIERIWLFMLQMHPDFEDNLKAAAAAFQRSAIAANILRQAQLGTADQESPYDRDSDLGDLVGAMARLEAKVNQLSSRKGA